MTHEDFGASISWGKICSFTDYGPTCPFRRLRAHSFRDKGVPAWRKGNRLERLIRDRDWSVLIGVLVASFTTPEINLALETGDFLLPERELGNVAGLCALSVRASTLRGSCPVVGLQRWPQLVCRVRGYGPRGAASYQSSRDLTMRRGIIRYQNACSYVRSYWITPNLKPSVSATVRMRQKRHVQVR
jgi:hypothetical protein